MRVLAVDDEELMLAKLANSIREAIPNVELTPIRRPSKALEYVKNNPIDIAFLDVEMRGLTGVELAKEINQIQPNANIIFVTGFMNYAMDAFHVYASDYILKPVNAQAILESLNHLRHPLIEEDNQRLQVKCFGEFSVFYKEKPIHFGRQKSMELFAYLVDRRGSPVTMAQVANILWEDGQYDISRNRQLHTFVSVLIKTFEDIGIHDIVIRQHNSISIDTSKIDCDYYQFIDGDEQAMKLYMGEYMSQYSWADVTNIYLMRRSK